MNIDWVVAFSMFLIVVAWSFTFYMGMFDAKTQPLASVIDTISDRVISFLKTDTYTMHGNYTYTGLGAQEYYYMDVDFPNGTSNSTKIYQDSTLLLANKCTLKTNQIVFLTTILYGNNSQFAIKFQNATGAAYCTENDDGHLKIMGSAKEKRMLVSQAKINELAAMTNDGIKGNLSINRDFRIEIEVNETVINTFGYSPPNATSVYVKESWSKIFDDDNRCLIRVMVW